MRPCIRNIPELTSLQAEYGSRGLVVIGCSWEPAEILGPFTRKMGASMKYHVVSDVKETLLSRLTDLEAVEGFPYAFLVGRDGRVAWEGHPKHDDLAGAVKRYVATDRGR